MKEGFAAEDLMNGLNRELWLIYGRKSRNQEEEVRPTSCDSKLGSIGTIANRRVLFLNYIQSLNYNEGRCLFIWLEMVRWRVEEATNLNLHGKLGLGNPEASYLLLLENPWLSS